MKRTMLILALAALLPACALKSSVKSAYSSGFMQADRQCMALQAQLQQQQTALLIQNTQYRERLGQFEQINADGSLRYKTIQSPEPMPPYPAPQAAPVPVASVTPTSTPTPQDVPVAPPPGAVTIPAQAVTK